jgi:hypothetical protein
VVNVSGIATLGGTLDVSLTGGFTPVAGEMFTVLTAGSVIYDGLVLGGSAAGSFYLLVGPTSISLQASGVPGDFNFDGVVDDGDYVVWRKDLGTKYLPSHYDIWRSHYGASLTFITAVPEPASAVMFLCGMLPFIVSRRVRSRLRSRVA